MKSSFKLIITLLTFSLFLSCDNQSAALKEKVNDLELATTDDLLAKGTFSYKLDEIKIYDATGKEINANEFSSIVQSQMYKQDFYLDEKGNVGAIVMVPLNEKERNWNAKKDEGKELAGTISPDFEVTDTDGKKYDLASLKGKVVVINAWFIECKPCIKEIPELNKLVKDFENDEVVFLGFAKNNKSELHKFLTKRNFAYNQVVADSDLLSKFSVNVYPTNIILDKNAKITFYETALQENIYHIMKAHITKSLDK
ncbi:peroxiredoxin family protein [Pontibacter populi]|uniref:TlpA disulfide reductase family protein n=1 Tax=Pontibacter populi TaxID=890055 RepID=A0ABV1RSF7_9BACT